jgi:carbonic anhydrase
VGNKKFSLKQFHFHTPSEHTINGMHYPMEMHLVHVSDSGELAVFGVFFERGKHNKNFDDIVTHLPDAPGEKKQAGHVTVDPDALLPASRECFSYSGSLTTPPCSEGVSWFLAMNPVEMSTAQIEEFTSRLRQNNRPPQALNSRKVSKVTVQ